MTRVEEQRPHRIRLAISVASIAMIVAFSVAAIKKSPDGLLFGIAMAAAVTFVSLYALRSNQLKLLPVVMDSKAAALIEAAMTTGSGELRFVAHKASVKDYRTREEESRERHSIQLEEGAIIFLEVELAAHKNIETIEVKGIKSGDYSILRCKSDSAPTAVAAMLLHVRDQAKTIPHVYMGWTDAHPLTYAFRYVFFGEGETAPLTRELIRLNEPEESRRPFVHVA